MSADWTYQPKPDIQLVGTITYRCDACHEMIEGEHVLTPLDPDGRVTQDTRAYHPDHTPPKEG